mgnify:CR=1 FL=1
MEKIRIKLKSYDHTLLDKCVEELVKAIKKTGAKVKGPIPLPTKRTLISVLRSPHVYKKSFEQFELKIHKRLIEVTDTNEQTIRVMEQMTIPEGVDIEMKQV